MTKCIDRETSKAKKNCLKFYAVCNKMFVKNLREDFYNYLIGQRILVLANYDIDAICACKILQALFKNDHMLYTLVPIMGVAGLQRAYEEHQKEVKYVLFLNCGGCTDLIDLLHPNDDIVFYVCDAHRPLDVCNIYNDGQIRIISEPTVEDNIPPFEAIFYESDSENEVTDDDNDDVSDKEFEVDENMAQGSKNRRNRRVDSDVPDTENTNEEDDDNSRSSSSNLRPPLQKLSRIDKMQQKILNERKRRHWELERDRVMFDYTQYSYYGRSTAMSMFELAWKLSKDNMNMLWYAIVGLTEQLILGKIESSVYTLEIEIIQSHASRLTNKSNEQNNLSASKICFENDLHLVLYRHWSVSESMKHSLYSACKLKLWTLRGEKRLHELLVEMGLPLMQARQTFSSMDLILRQEFYGMIEKLADKYGMPDIVYGSFTLYYGYRSRYSGADYVYAILAILESVKKGKKSEDCFLEALAALSRNNKELLSNGIENAKMLFSAVFKQVHGSLEARLVISTGSFFYYVLTEENTYFSSPYGLYTLAKFILHGHVAISRSRQAKDLPLIASCPLDGENGLCLLVGISPVSETSTKNFFGKAFAQTASKSNIIILQDFFETSMIQIKQNDLTRFLDALTVLLT